MREQLSRGRYALLFFKAEDRVKEPVIGGNPVRNAAGKLGKAPADHDIVRGEIQVSEGAVASVRPVDEILASRYAISFRSKLFRSPIRA